MSDNKRYIDDKEFDIRFQSSELWGNSKKELTKYWVAEVLFDGTHYYTSTFYWHQKSDRSKSKTVHSTPKKILGKNIGKSNETSPLDQAVSEVVAMEKHQLKKGYNSSYGDPLTHISRPMLSQKYNPKKLEKVIYLQPKLDGMRALMNSSQNMYSRESNLISNHPEFGIDIDPKYELDGELILPHPYTFQQTIASIKKRNQDTDGLEYVIFDLIVKDEPNLIFSERWKILQSLDIGQATLVRTERVEFHTPILLENMMFSYICKGYEGLMIRLDQPYCIGHRSHALMKMKSMDDGEFTIIGGKSGEGNDEGCIVFICEMPGGQTFDVRPKGSVAYRKELLTNLDKYIGKQLTVKYQGYTDDNLPRFPVGLAIRDYE